MLISFDKTNFPLIAIESAAIEVHLLPITKWQFKQFMAESKAVKFKAYKKMLDLNPTISPDTFPVDERERLFITGLLPKEGRAFAQWLGQGFDFPTIKEWRAIYDTLRVTSIPYDGALSSTISGPAGQIVTKLSKQLDFYSMLDLSLMNGGLVEWVWQDKEMVGLGAPRPTFHPNLWDPFSHEVKPLRSDERLPYFGLRLVRRGKWYLADEDNVRYIN